VPSTPIPFPGQASFCEDVAEDLSINSFAPAGRRTVLPSKLDGSHLIPLLPYFLLFEEAFGNPLASKQFDSGVGAMLQRETVWLTGLRGSSEATTGEAGTAVGCEPSPFLSATLRLPEALANQDKPEARFDLMFKAVTSAALSLAFHLHTSRLYTLPENVQAFLPYAPSVARLTLAQIPGSALCNAHLWVAELGGSVRCRRIVPSSSGAPRLIRLPLPTSPPMHASLKASTRGYPDQWATSCQVGGRPVEVRLSRPISRLMLRSVGEGTLLLPGVPISSLECIFVGAPAGRGEQPLQVSVLAVPTVCGSYAFLRFGRLPSAIINHGGYTVPYLTPPRQIAPLFYSDGECVPKLVVLSDYGALIAPEKVLTAEGPRGPGWARGERRQGDRPSLEAGKTGLYIVERPLVLGTLSYSPLGNSASSSYRLRTGMTDLEKIYHLASYCNGAPSPVRKILYLPPGLRASKLAHHIATDTFVVCCYTSRFEIRAPRSVGKDEVAAIKVYEEVRDYPKRYGRDQDSITGTAKLELIRKCKEFFPATNPPVDSYSKIKTGIVLLLRGDTVSDFRVRDHSHSEHSSCLASDLLSSDFPERIGDSWRHFGGQYHDEYGRLDRRNRLNAEKDRWAREVQEQNLILERKMLEVVVLGTTYALGPDEKTCGYIRLFAVEPAESQRSPGRPAEIFSGRIVGEGLDRVGTDSTEPIDELERLQQTGAEKATPAAFLTGGQITLSFRNTRWGCSENGTNILFSLHTITEEEFQNAVTATCAAPDARVLLVSEAKRVCAYSLRDAKKLLCCSVVENYGYISTMARLNTFFAISDLFLETKLTSFRGKGNRHALVSKFVRTVPCHIAEFFLGPKNDIAIAAVSTDRVVHVLKYEYETGKVTVLNKLCSTSSIRIGEFPVKAIKFPTMRKLWGAGEPPPLSRNANICPILVCAEGGVLAVLPTETSAVSLLEDIDASHWAMKHPWSTAAQMPPHFTVRELRAIDFEPVHRTRRMPSICVDSQEQGQFCTADKLFRASQSDSAALESWADHGYEDAPAARSLATRRARQAREAANGEDPAVTRSPGPARPPETPSPNEVLRDAQVCHALIEVMTWAMNDEACCF